MGATQCGVEGRERPVTCAGDQAGGGRVPGDLFAPGSTVHFKVRSRLCSTTHSRDRRPHPEHRQPRSTTTPNQESSRGIFFRPVCSWQDRSDGLSGRMGLPKARASFHDLALSLRGTGFWGPYTRALAVPPFPTGCRADRNQSSRGS